MSKRLALRAGFHLGVDAVLMFEDDVVFHPEFKERAGAIDLPEDWGLFYFGCIHRHPPRVIAPGLVRVTRALDNHAIAVRRSYWLEVQRRLSAGGRKAKGQRSSDQMLADLHERIPTYAAYPNLVWQEAGWSDVALCTYSNYDGAGCQRLWPESVLGFDMPGEIY